MEALKIRTKDKNGENVPLLEITEVTLIHCNIVKNDWQQDLRVLRLFGHLLDLSPKHFIFLKTSDSQFWYIEVWFNDQTFKPLEIEHKINITLAIN